jgi:L-iditol 2-dehydrogenase
MDRTYPMAFVTAPGRIEFQERTLPELGQRGVLLKVRAASICGSDLHIVRGKHPRAPLPGALGHEVAGEVAGVGPGVTRVREGDRVALEPVIACGQCEACRCGQYNHCPQLTRPHRVGRGGFTPFMVVDEAWLHPLPSGVSFAEGALVEPLAVAVHAVKRAGARLGQSLAIFGAGPLGLLTLQVARAAGMAPSFVADLRVFRLRAAERLQASQVIDAGQADAPAVIEAATGGRGVDVAVEAVGATATLAGALRTVKQGGTAIVIGIFEDEEVPMPANLLTGREVSLVGCRGYCWDFQDSLALLARGAVALDALITHRLPLSELQHGFDLLLDPASEAIKVVIEVS